MRVSPPKTAASRRTIALDHATVRLLREHRHRQEAERDAARDRWQVAQRLRAHAADGRWRVREGVAMALQRLGDVDLPRLFDIAADWADDPHPLVQRAAVAGVCEPRLLRTRTPQPRRSGCATG